MTSIYRKGDGFRDDEPPRMVRITSYDEAGRLMDGHLLHDTGRETDLTVEAFEWLAGTGGLPGSMVIEETATIDPYVGGASFTPRAEVMRQARALREQNGQAPPSAQQ